MPMNNFSVGRDISLTITTPNGQLSTFNVTKFTSKEDVVQNKVKLLNGVTRHQRFPDGWSGSFEVERGSSELDDYFASIEEGYYAGRNETGASITEIIQEVDGSISEFQYTDVILTLASAGEWAGETTVKQQVTWVGSRRIKRQ